MNASCTCVLVSKIIYDVKMTVSWKGSDCLNAQNACFDHAIWTSIWTFCLGSEMKNLPSCSMIAYPLSVISWISLDVMRIPETWSMDCSSIVIDVCIYNLFFEI